ncbi:phosphoribosyltransferase [Cereibacter sphaeroides]|uniref:phosphoribosyltransferase n=1 Tax=Cereibacter sphaeroides TaxID=1063 RepID=UPI001F255827|nr:phosphoribosyltransferase family protein [Cereibacter sphaeroides]MCE6960778.1 phosphoribosyltransferase [Cereibacter sphaeroides]MCE6974344.1 phosphoribosyltransferase [Cereibacter sphaeroides]
MPLLTDRTEAGQRLAERLSDLRAADALVLALPRGGVPVAVEIARALECPLDLLLVRKVGLPGYPELAIAAVSGPEGQDLVVNEALLSAVGLSLHEIDALAEKERAELARRRRLWQLGAEVPVSGRTVILVDDGMATGTTMLAALQSLRALKPARIVVALPVAATSALAVVRPLVDRIECLVEPDPFVAVGAHYDQFPQVPDETVGELLADRRKRGHRPH